MATSIIIKQHPKFSIQSTSVSNISLAANATQWVNVPHPVGYTPIAPAGWYMNGATSVTIYSMGLSTEDSTNIALRNLGTAQANFTLTIRWLCAD